MTGQPKFTPGPWVADVTDPSDAVVWASPDPKQNDELIANIGHRFQPVQVAFDCDAANAHLIAAAPDLYAALEGLMRVLVGTWDCDESGGGEAWESARSALAKARGQA